MADLLSSGGRVRPGEVASLRSHRARIGLGLIRHVIIVLL